MEEKKNFKTVEEDCDSMLSIDYDVLTTIGRIWR